MFTTSESVSTDSELRIEDRLLGPTFWLELDDRDANKAAGGDLRQASWGDPRAKLRSLSCGGERL